MNGVLGIAPDMILSAKAWTRSSFLALCLLRVALIHMLAQYVSMGRITVVYNHLQVLGVIPQVGPTALLHCISDVVAFFVMFVICSLKLSLLSNVTPRNLTDLDNSIGMLPTLMGRRVHFLFQVNITILVLSALIERPLVEHQFSMVFMVR